MLATNYSDLDFGFDDLDDLPAVLAELRAQHGDYARVRAFGQPATILLTHELVTAAFADEETFPSADEYGPATAAVLGRTLQCMTGDEHRTNRALVSPSFRRQLMGDYIHTLLEPIAHELVDEFVADGRADLVSQFTEVLPKRVIEGLLGLPVEYRDRCARWAQELFLIRQAPERARAASEGFTAMLDELLTERRANPGVDLISVLAHADIDGEQLTDEEIFSFVRLLFPAGVDTTFLTLGNAIRALLLHPDQLAQLRQDPSLLPWVGEEILRWCPSPVSLQRVAPRDLTWRGIDFRSGEKIMLSVAAAGRDPYVYEDPERFDITRKVRAKVAFGHGPHVCLGMWLARAEMEVGLRVLLDRLDEIVLSDPDAARVSNWVGAILRGPQRLEVTFKEK